MSEFKNQVCTCPEQPGQKYESGLLFTTKMPALFLIGDCVIVRVTYKGYIECLNEDNHVTVWLIFGRNTDIFPQRDEEARRGDILSIKKERYRESWVLGVRKIVQQ